MLDLWPYILSALAAVSAIVIAFLKGRDTANTKHELKELKDDRETTENIDRAKISAASSDPAKWLRDRKQRRDMP